MSVSYDQADARALARRLDGARLVVFDEDLELVFQWNGSLTINATDLSGQDVDVRMLGGIEGDPIAAQNEIEDWRNELR